MLRDVVGLAVTISLLLFSQAVAEQLQRQPIQQTSFDLAPPQVSTALQQIREIH